MSSSGYAKITLTSTKLYVIFGASYEQKEVIQLAQIDVKLQNLLAQVELETGERPTYADIQNETQIAQSTLSRFANGKASRYDTNTLISLVEFFNKRLEHGCELADLIQYPPRPVIGQEVAVMSLN